MRLSCTLAAVLSCAMPGMTRRQYATRIMRLRLLCGFNTGGLGPSPRGGPRRRSKAGPSTTETTANEPAADSFVLHFVHDQGAAVFWRHDRGQPVVDRQPVCLGSRAVNQQPGDFHSGWRDHRPEYRPAVSKHQPGPLDDAHRRRVRLSPLYTELKP